MPSKAPVFQECGICGFFHRETYWGDCRNDAERYTLEQIEEKFPDGFDIVYLDD